MWTNGQIFFSLERDEDFHLFIPQFVRSEMLVKSWISVFLIYLLGLGYVESGTDAVGDGYGGLDWYQNLPAVAIDYKITIEAGKFGQCVAAHLVLSLTDHKNY